MKKIVLLIFIANSIIAQNISYSVSEDFKEIPKYGFGIFKFGPNKFGNVHYIKSDCYKIQIFDSTFNKVIKEETVAFPEEIKQSKNGMFKKFKDNFYSFHSTFKDKAASIYALSFDPKTLTLSSQPKKILDVNDVQKGQVYSEFSYEPNADSSLFLVQYTKEFQSLGDFKNSFATIGYAIFDIKLNKLYSTEIQYPYPIENIFFISPSSYLDKNGDIYILARVKVNNSVDGMNLTKDNSLMRLELLKLNKKNNTWQKQRIELENNKYAGPSQIKEDLNGSLYVLGTYTNVNPIDESLLGNSKIPSSDGIYMLHITSNPNGELIKNHSDLFEFPDEVIKLYEDKFRWKNMNKKGNFEFESLSLKNIVFGKNSNVLFISESIDYDLGMAEDIIILKVSDKKTEWCHKIPKAQYLSSSSINYYHFRSKNSEYIFYMDDSKNLNLTTEDKPHGYKPGENGSMLCAKIDSNGVLTKSSIFDTKNFKVKALASVYKEINENSFIIKSSDNNDMSKIFKLMSDSFNAPIPRPYSPGNQ